MRLFYWKKWEKYQISPIAIAGLINVASLTKSIKKVTRKANTCTFKPSVSGHKIPCGNFPPEKRSGIAVRVAERFGTWQAKRPTTHNTRSMKNLPGIFCALWYPNGSRHPEFSKQNLLPVPSGDTSNGDKAALAPNSAYYSFSFAVCVPSLRFASVFRVVPAVFPRLVAAVRTLPPFSAFGLWCVVPASPSVFPIFRPTLFPLAVKHDDTWWNG